MNKSHFVGLASLAALAAPGAALAGNSETGFWFPGAAKEVCAIGQQAFDDSWQKITFPEATGWAKLFPFAEAASGQSFGPVYDTASGMVYVFPPNSPAFTESSSDVNCDFFTWSSQMFYWLTSPVTAGASFPANPTPPTADTDYVFASEFFYHLEGDALVTQGDTLKTSGTRTMKSNDDTDTIEQAGGGGVLFYKPQAGSNDAQMVYYSVHTNRPFGYLRAGRTAKASYVPDQFPDSQAQICDTILYGFLNGYADITDPIATGLYALYCAGADSANAAGNEELQKQAEGAGADLTASAITVEKVETAVDYLAMTVELKMSWVEADTLSDPGSYIQQTGTIPTFTKQADGSLTQSGTKTTALALVGMHVVGSVKGHPEMVWSTFEHINNAPNVDYVYLGSDGGIEQWSDLNQGEWLFSNGTGTDANVEYAFGKTPKGGVLTISAPSGGSNADLATPTNVNRLSPWGSHLNSMYGKSEVTGVAQMNSAVISTNTAAVDALNGAYTADQSPSDPRVNYILTGSSWGTDGVFPEGGKVSQISGTPAMANMTMETFQQIYQGQISQTGCFSCHGVGSNPSKFAVSHIFHNIASVDK